MSGSIFQNASSPPNQALINQNSGLVIEVDCDASVYVGAAVIMDNTGTAFNALADDISTSNVLGLVESKTSITRCKVRVSGATLTNFVGLDPSQEYFLSDTVAGDITTTAPTTTGHVVFRVGQPLSATRMVVDRILRVVRS